jgi:Trypsin-like peptidase domain
VDIHRAVELLTDLHRAEGPTWRLGSGFVVQGGVVLTAAHVLGGENTAVMATIWVRDLDGREWPASLIVADDEADLAALSVPGLAPDVAPMPLARIVRDEATVLPDVVAVGFPGFKDAPEKPKAKRRQTAQADGWIPTGESYQAGDLVLKLRAAPPQITPGSPWEGFSGAGVVWDGSLVAIAIEYRPAEGPGSLTTHPVSALATAPKHKREDFERACGVADITALDPVSVITERFPTEPTLRVRLDRVRRYTRRTRSGSTTFGTAPGPHDAIAYGEGAVVQASVENGSSSPAVVSALDVVVRSHDAGFDADYPVVALNQMHMEVPITVLADPLVLDEMAQLDGAIPINAGQIALDPAGTAMAHHTFDLAVVGADHGLWQLAVRARYFGAHDPQHVAEAYSEKFYVVKK